MNTQMSRDFEQLSAYIDNQLSPAEKAALEARLAKEAELQATLNDLRRTVKVLRGLPPVKPPRSFTLTPQQAGVRARRGPLFPVFRLAAALCTLLLVAAVARDFATSSLSASTASDLTTSTTQGGAVTTLAAPNAAAVLATPTPGGVVETYGASAPVPTGNPGADVAVTPFSHLAPAGPDETATPASDQLAATADATRKNLAPSETPEDTAVSVAALPPSATESVASQPAQLPSTSSAQAELRVAEIVLAALALALAAAAWFTRRG